MDFGERFKAFIIHTVMSRGTTHYVKKILGGFMKISSHFFGGLRHPDPRTLLASYAPEGSAGEAGRQRTGRRGKKRERRRRNGKWLRE